MLTDILQAQYDDLNAIAARFEQWAEATDELTGRVRRRGEDLAQGGWEGCGADAFFVELTAQILPALHRLRQALDEARATTQDAAETVMQAEEEAAMLFQGGGAVAGRPVSPTQATTASSPSTSTIVPNGRSNHGGTVQTSGSQPPAQLLSTLRARWGREHIVEVNGARIAVYGNRVTPAHLETIRTTLSVLPPEHLALVPPIRVREYISSRDRVTNQPIRLYDAGGSGTVGNPKVRPELQHINIAVGALDNRSKYLPVMDDPQDRRAHLTILHEVGHTIQKRRGILPAEGDPTLDEYRHWFRRTYPHGYGGHTDGSGEWAAEAYSRYVRTGQPVMVRDSPAFQGVTDWRNRSRGSR